MYPYKNEEICMALLIFSYHNFFCILALHYFSMWVTSRAIGTIVAIVAMAATLFSNYLTCDIQNALIKLAALQYTFLWPCFLMIIASLSCYPMRDSMGLVARLIIKIIITVALS